MSPLAVALVAVGLAGPLTPADTTFLIRGATVVDGTGAPARRAAVRVEGDRIAAVGALEPRQGEAVVDARGLVLAPGFVDTHSHHDRGLLEHPGALGAVSQGITTIVVGQDGGSSVPLADFFAAVADTGVAVNVASYAGHGTIRQLVMGREFRREATPAEVDSMRAVLRRELEAGALGLSTGLEYDPGIYASTEEVIALAREAARAGGRYISHVRSEDRRLWEAVDEAVRIGREAGLPVQISHMKLAMQSLWGGADGLLARLDSARASGVDVTADVYPYTYWQSTMTVLFPQRDFDDRAVAAFALEELVPPEGMRIAEYEPEPAYEGRTLAEVAEARGEDPVTAYMALIARAEAADADESILATSMAEEDVVALLSWEHANVASDGGLLGGHPRGFGAFTRVVGPWVRQGHLTLERAVRKASAAGAEHVGIADRGVIRPGAFADLVLFDPARVADRATPDSSRAVSAGVERVWVNGRVVYEGGAGLTGARPGRVLRRRDPAGGGPADPRPTNAGAAPRSAASRGPVRSAPAAAACSSPGHRQFDFWLGEWEVEHVIHVPGGGAERYGARSTVERAAGGCALVERWRGRVRFPWEGMSEPDSLHGLSVRSYVPDRDEWTVLWMDDRNPSFGAPFVGRFEDGRGVFVRRTGRVGGGAGDGDEGGGELLSRIVFEEIDTDSPVWTLAVSGDGGHRWTTLWTMRFRRP